MDQSPSPNPIADYANTENIKATELGRRLGVSKGSASELINGKRKVGPKVAKRMESLTGRPWHEFVTEAMDP